ncbi:MAG: tyrosine-protein phosphatase [Burkholderiaceae bacterium]
MNVQGHRHLPLPGTHNLRDLGGYRAGGASTAWRAIFRSDRPSGLTATGLERMRELGCRTIIDLRSDDERLSAPSAFEARGAPFAYHPIPLFGALDPHRADVYVSDDPLLDLYCQALDGNGPVFASVFRTIAQAPPGAVLVNCTAGKDRTGMVSAMLLLLAGVDHDEVTADYTLTARYLAPFLDQLRQEAAGRGRDLALFEKLLRSEASTMRGFLGHLDRVHGGAQAYLSRHGLNANEIGRLRARMLGLAA